MKKIFTTFALAAFAMTSFAQSPKYQQYFRVEFNCPIVADGSGKTSVGQMGDSYTYCNPEHNVIVNGEKHGWILIQAGGNLNCYGTVGNFIALDENGVLNTDGVVKARNGDESSLFEAGVQYTVTIAAFGYPELVFPYVKEA